MIERSISVVIPTCDRLNLLKKALESVSRQNLKPNEIIVVNNGKEKFCKSDLEFTQNIKLYNIDEYVGPAKARNYGYNKASSKYIAFLDDDDTWSNNYIEDFVNNIDDYYDCYLARSKTIVNNEIVDYKNPKNKISLQYLFLNNPGIGGSNIIFKKNINYKKNIFDETLWSAEDKALIIDLLLNNKKIKILENCFTIYNSDKSDNKRLSNSKNILVNKKNFYKKYKNFMKLTTKLKFLKKYLKIYLLNKIK